MRPRPAGDLWLLAGVLVLLVFGLLMVWSTTQYVPPKPVIAEAADNAEQSPAVSPAGSRILKQLAWALIGVALMLIFKRVDYRRLNHPAWALGGMALSLALLGLVYFVDGDRHRFLRAGPVGLQPSELAKPALVVFLAYFLTERAKVLNDSRVLAPAAMTVGLMAGAVMVADVGTAVVLVATTAALFLVAGLERRYFALAGAVTAVFLVIAILSEPYRLARVLAYLDPQLKIVAWLGVRDIVEPYLAKSKGARDPTYHAKQSLVAVGSGGLLGRGPMKGEHKLGYLPEAHNDFIYAVVGEELGLVGSSLLLALFVIILWRGMRLARSALDDFGRYLALGVTTLIVFQAFMNMSVVLGLAPTKGIPLPMISYGGSSLACTLILFGMLLSVSDRTP